MAPDDRHAGEEETQTVASATELGAVSPALDDTLEASPFDDRLPRRSRGRYDIGDEIGRGGLGRVLEAFDRQLGRRVAIKELLGRGRQSTARFIREATVTARLEHPAIVPVHEAGRWDDGEPFYAMKLVDGQQLKDVAQEAKTLADRIALLPHILAVADALAYAHAEGIVHRDIKPSNLLVGAYGETVVIDWGLAKDMKATDQGDEATDGGADADDDDDDDDDDANLTAAGTVLGTPAYMSPEQAAGDIVDERTDVYAIGAVLYFALSGSPLYDLGDSQAVLEKVLTTAPVPIEVRVPELPADLAAIVGRAIARDPNARYKNAGELASDLRRFQRGQLVGAHRYSGWQLIRRWLARHRAAVAVATLMSAVLLVVGVIGITRITRERDRAEANREDAEELINFMLFDLHHKLEALGSLEVLDMVAQRASAYWETRDVDLSKPDETRKRAVAHSNFGDVLKVRGQLDAALAEFEKARSICRRLLAVAPHVDCQRVIALVGMDIGDIRQSHGDFANGLAEYRTSKGIFERQVDENPDDAAALREVGVLFNRIGNLYRDHGDLNESMLAHEKAVEVSEKLLAMNPENNDSRHGVIASRAGIARVHRARGDNKKALEHYQRLAEAYEELVGRASDNILYQRNLSTSYGNVGDLATALGDTAGALKALDAGRAIRERLTARDPGSAMLQDDLANMLERIGYVHRMRGETRQALESLRAAKTIREKLVRVDPDNTEQQSELAMGRNILGDVLRDSGDLAGALVEYEASMVIRERLVKKDPSNDDWQRDYSLGHSMLGDIYRRRGETARALAEYRVSLAIRERLAAKTPDHSRPQRDLAVTLLDVGGLLVARGDEADGKAILARSASLYEGFASGATDYYNTACVFALAGSPDKAFEMLAAAADKGFRMADHAAQDGDLASLHGDARWHPTLATMRE